MSEPGFSCIQYRLLTTASQGLTCLFLFNSFLYTRPLHVPLFLQHVPKNMALNLNISHPNWYSKSPATNLSLPQPTYHPASSQFKNTLISSWYSLAQESMVALSCQSVQFNLVLSTLFCSSWGSCRTCPLIICSHKPFASDLDRCGHCPQNNPTQLLP